MTDSHGKIIVGLSGGVDSAVACLLLLEQGHEVEALFMKNWDEDDEAGYCPAAQDLEDAQAVCDRLQIRLHTISFSTEYWDRVFDHFLEEYRQGRTPNPDIMCNKEIKFRAFLDYALQLGAGHIATGHYARTRRIADRVHLCMAADADKDQTYFLYRLNQHALQHSLFPIGHLQKSEVRDLAAKAGFTNHAKKDSTGICFIGERKFSAFLARYLPAQPGDILSVDHEYLGQHQGLMYHTQGQRQGLGIGGVQGKGDAPWYVVDKDLKNNILLVAQGKDHPRLYHRHLQATQMHWIDRSPQDTPFHCKARIRHRQALQECRIMTSEGDQCQVEFAQPQRAIAPGQSIVFYHEEECLGGAIIDRRW